MTGEELKRHRETVAAVLKHMDTLTREDLIERLNWRPEGYQEDAGALESSGASHTSGNGTPAAPKRPSPVTG
jgi:hypothetical protein